MEIKTYPMKVAEGRVYAEITLRDVVERTKDLSDTPILAEIKRLYDENDKLREAASRMWRWMERARYAGSVRGHDMDAIAEELSALGIEVES